MENPNTMPGQLKPDAKCPKCGDPLEALVDTSNEQGVSRKYFHGKRHAKVRRMLPCKAYFESHVQAATERKALEV